MQRKTYVLDTNIIVDYVDIIPDQSSRPPEDPTIDLSEAHIVIPTAVIRELSSFKKETSDRGRAARIALKRLRGIFENCGDFKFKDFYELNCPIKSEFSDQIFSIFPISHGLDGDFKPSSTDMDGQIILAAMEVARCLNNRFEDYGSEVILLSNDNGLAIRAAARGVKTSRYGHKYPEPYTGRRDLEVPDELFSRFMSAGYISREDWENLMPNEPPLIANEFLVMTPKTIKLLLKCDNLDYFPHIGRYDADIGLIVPLKYISRFPCPVKNPGQAIYAEALMDPDIPVVICTGPAGSGKTFMATVYAYEACKSGQFIGTTVVPCLVEDSVGFLPGNMNEKLDPSVQPIKNALRNYLLQFDKDIVKMLRNAQKFGTSQGDSQERGRNSDQQSQKSIKARLRDQVNMIWENWFDNVPIEHARGRDFAHEIAFYDEFQDQNRSQADTLTKRIGEAGKMIITGDIEQVHAAYLDKDNNGLVFARNELIDSPLVAQISFTENEVVRHPLVKMIAERQKNKKTPPSAR